MKTFVVDWLYRWRIWQDCHGQDMVEFALLASLVAVATGLFMPELRESMDTIYSRVKSKLIEAGG
jgi:Flp pilus assembly pilin Flp